MAYYFSPIGNGVAFVDSNGAPLSGAKLFTYTAGSSTKSTVWQDNAGASAHSNPMTLDANGRPPAAVWLLGSVSYKFVLAPSNDTDPPASAIYTWDNVSGINDTSVSIDEWVAGATPTYVGATQFTVVGDQTTDYHVGRRIKATVTAGTVYGRISVSAYTTLTTLTVVLDSGNLDSGLSAVSLGLATATNPSIDVLAVKRAAGTDIANTFSGANTFSAANTFTADQTFQSSDAGAAIGPSIILDRNSASPAASDVIGAVQFKGRDSGGTAVDYARIGSTISDPTDASEDGILTLQTSVAGTLATRATITAGLQMGSPTGGDKGSGTINAASTMYVNNVPVMTSSGWQTYSPTVTLVGGDGNTVPVYSTNVGRYMQIGNIIFVFVRLAGDGGAEGAGTGVLNINLPATPGASAEQGYSPVGHYVNGASQNSLSGDITASTSTMALKTISGANLTGADQADTSRSITLRFFYEV